MASSESMIPGEVKEHSHFAAYVSNTAVGFEIFLVLQKFFLQRLQEIEFQTKQSATLHQMVRTTPPCRYVSLTELHKALGVS